MSACVIDVIVISNCHWLSGLTSHGHVTCWACHSFYLTLTWRLTWRSQEIQDHRHGLQRPLVHEWQPREASLGPVVLRERGQGTQPDLPLCQTFHGHFVKIWFDIWILWILYSFVDFVLFMLLILWILWIFVWCLNSGDGFSLEGRGPACEALVCEGGDRETEAFAVVRRWWGAASVSHRRWTDTGRLDLDHVSRWKWRILGLQRWPGILEWRSLTTSSLGMTKSNLTSSFAPSGLERHEGVEPYPLSHKSKCTCTGKQNCSCRLNTCVCVCMLSLTMFACPVIDCLVLFCSCPVRVLSCHWLVDVTHCFSLVEFFTCCDMDLTTQVWCLPRLPQLQAKRREWPITRKKVVAPVCACRHECFWEGFRFSMTSSSLPLW